MTGSLGRLVAGVLAGARRASAVAALALALAWGAGATGAAAQDYEIWALDQGTHMLHIYDSDLEEVERVDLGAEGVQTPHMIDFTSDHAYAFIASTGSADVTVMRTEDREILARLETGPRTHMAVVKPDDSAVIADVIGSPDSERDGKLVEITIDRENEAFEIGRELVISEDSLFQEHEERFSDTGAICHEYTADGRYAYVTLGPALVDGGLVILDTESFELVRVYPADEVEVNCGTVRTVDGGHMIVNGGGPETGVWYALDASTHEVVHQDSSRGYDAHGVWPTPDGREIWMVNRITDNAIIIDPQTFEITEELDDVGETPDIVAMSPDSRYAFITLRGPNPVSAPHVAIGGTPGFSVMDIESRELVEIVQPAEGNEDSDFHGIGVRVLHD